MMPREPHGAWNAALAVIVAAIAAFGVAFTPSAAGDPVSVNVTGNTEADLVAVSVLGNASCDAATCAAVTPTGHATAGCADADACEDSIVHCGDFTCAAVAVTAIGSSEAYTYCDTFGQVCVAVTVGPRLDAYACYGDVTGSNFCRGLL